MTARRSMFRLETVFAIECAPLALAEQQLTFDRPNGVRWLDFIRKRSPWVWVSPDSVRHRRAKGKGRSPSTERLVIAGLSAVVKLAVGYPVRGSQLEVTAN